MTKTICVTNQKGGSGKTTLCALLAYTLAGEGKRVLCIDTDPQAGLTALMGIDPGPGLFELLMGGGVTIAQGKGGIDFIRGDHRLDKLAYSISPFQLETALEQFDHDFIIIDTPPTVQGITRAACIAADKIIIPADISKTTIGPTVYTLESLKEIKKTGRVILIGKAPGEFQTGFTVELWGEFMKTLGQSYLGSLPRSVTAQKAAAGFSKMPKALNQILRGIA